MSWLSTISLAHRKLAALIFLLVLAFGAAVIPSIKQQVLPDLNLPVIGIVAADPGSSPAVVEQQIVEPLEAAVAGVAGIESTTSTSRQGAATVALFFTYGTDLTDAQAQVVTAVSKAAATLPTGVSPQVFVASTSDLPTLTLSVASSTTDQQELADRLRSRVAPELERIDGVNEVTVSGERGRVVRVTPDPAKLAAAGLTVDALSAALAPLGRTRPAGTVSDDRSVISVQVGGPLTGPRDLERLTVAPAAPGGDDGGRAARPVRLADVATVTVTEAPATSLTRTDGRPSLGVALTMGTGGSSAHISEQVHERLPDLRDALGEGAALTVVSDFGPSVRDSVQGLLVKGALGMVMAVLVIVLFLRSLRSTVVAAVSIPLSLVIALIVLWQQGLSLNVLTLGALTIAVGRVVDDSIVVLENIKRHLGYGTARAEAVRTGVREVAGAVTSSTLTTVAVFVPIMAVSGLVGELFTPFSLTVAVAMLASLVVSLTVIPVLAYWFLKPPPVGADPERFRREAEEAERNGWLQRRYVAVLHRSLAHRRRVLVFGVVTLLASVGLAGLLTTTFIGDEGADTLTVTQRLAPGTGLGVTDAAAQRVEQVLSGLAEVESYQVTIGSAGGFGAAFSGVGADTASFQVALAPDADPAATRDLLTERLAALTGVGDLTVSSGEAAQSLVQIALTGDDPAALRTATSTVVDALTGLPALRKVTSDLAEAAPQITVTADPARAGRYGLTDAVLAEVVGRAVEGRTVNTLTIGDARYDLVLDPGPDVPTSVDEVRALALTTPAGRVRLDQVATVALVDAPTTRTLVDGEPTVTVTAEPAGTDTGAAGAAVRKALDGVDLPAGVTWSLGGVNADQEEAFRQLGLAMAAAVALVFLIVLATFRSVRQTLVLLVSVPFAATGAILLLLLTGTPLGLAGLIGLLMLIGIVVTNAIVLIDLVNQYREQGMPLTEALVEGGRRRLRPIVMTALATILALAPMALGIGAHGGFISQPLAIVVIGGLVSSTLLTLVLVPTLYAMVESRRGGRRRRVDPPVPDGPSRTDEVAAAVR
ncbi:efflux RND transporter permease subunit [Micromonospora rosaria]|uniref:efflux RND transporter permease subunit n=1 Tax=Micromonospora rosaria TaxID=47874 RepID=UPI0037CAE40A